MGGDKENRCGWCGRTSAMRGATVRVYFPCGEKEVKSLGFPDMNKAQLCCPIEETYFIAPIAGIGSC